MKSVAVALVVALATACTTTKYSERDAGTPQVIRSVGAPVAPAVEPWIHLTRTPSGLSLRVVEVWTCVVNQTAVQDRVRVEERRVGAVPIIAAGLLLSGGFYYYVNGEHSVDDSLNVGTVLVLAAGAVYGIPALTSGTTTTPISPESRPLPSGTAPCAPRVLAGALVELVDEVGVAEATTDAKGAARLRTPFGKLQLFVDGRPARIVEERP